MSTLSHMNRVELLIPAKDLSSGKVAINHGADALYVGASRFGARQAVGNSMTDLEQLIRYAHMYGSKVYVTVNTLLFDEELEDARQMIYAIYNAGADALIIQDLGLLKLDLPPISIHSSTQCHNVSLERVRFMEKLGFQRAILAREMDLESIRNIHENLNIELETFIHGALCVCYSGQCYMSMMVTNRSGNRGECAQLCRTRFDLLDSDGHYLLRQKHALSLKDMNRSAYLKDLIDAGVASFKVEGRLKDESYVKNVTAYYRQLLDNILSERADYDKVGSGRTTFFFESNPAKTFNRNFTPYFIDGRREKMASFDTPKSMGQEIGRLRQDSKRRLFYEGKETILNGDGLCFINGDGELEGFSVNKVLGDQLVPHKPISAFRDVSLYRNLDKAFEKILSGKTAERKILVDMAFGETETGFCLHLKDEDGCESESYIEFKKETARKPEVANQQLRTSFSKLGGTPFELRNLSLLASGYFIPSSVSNKLRSDGIDRLVEDRVRFFRPKDSQLHYAPEPYYNSADYKRNITNASHKSVYEDFGVSEMEYGLDKTMDFKGKEVMTCKYCIRYEMGLCLKQNKNNQVKAPLFLKNDKHRFRLEFDCKNCVMKVLSLGL